MSITVVSLLVVVGLGCAVVLTALLAVLHAAALGDRQLERGGGPSQPNGSTVEQAVGRPEIGEPGLGPSGRFRRAARDTQDQPLVR